RPSIETLLHGVVDAPVVIHTHADAIVSLTNNDKAADVLTAVYGKDVIALDYRRPGFKISREVADTKAAHPEARALLLEKHGTICWGATVREAYDATLELITRAEEAIAERKRGRRAFGGPRVTLLEPAARRAAAFGRYVSLSAKDAFDVEYWPLELYKLTLAPPEKELARRVVLVTGGGSGIGRAVAHRLAAEGAHVAVTDVDAASAARVADEMGQAVGPGRAVGLALDVTREASVREAFEETILRWGGLDVLVSNAGIAHSSPVDRMALADWERSFAVNATGHFLVAREAMRVLIRQGIGGA